MQYEIEQRPERNILSVGQVTQKIKDLLEGDIGFVCVRGEISNFRPAASGHLYFSLKDDSATISAALFRNTLGRLRNIKIENGVEVIARGKISVYAPRGTYQIIIESLEPVGAGGLQAQFEALKKKLLAEGLFAPERKRAIPRMPQKIAVVTSPSGAAIRDVLSVLGRRHSGVAVVIIPSLVQGQAAEQELIQGLALANDPRIGADVVLLTRGGGSLEDLWCFNSEALARAIAESRLPVVSAVGHEIDFTIADFVADLRAATPSAAAELLVQELGQLLDQVEEIQLRLARIATQVIANAKLRLAHLAAQLKSPKDRINELHQLFDDWVERLVIAMHSYIDGWKTEDFTSRLGELIQLILQRKQESLALQLSKLHSLSPLSILDRGYSLVYNESGEIIKDSAQAKPESAIRVRLAKGEIIAEVSKDWPR